MIASFMIGLIALAIALYVQAWLSAREIRRHRTQSKTRPARYLVLQPGADTVSRRRSQERRRFDLREILSP